jgi:membrane-bound lytic murein transglycosylase A
MARIRRIAALLAMSMCSACSLFAPKDHFGAREVTFASLAGWEAENHAEALSVFLNSCDTLGKKTSTTTKESNITIASGIWNSLCVEAKSASADQAKAKAFFETRFVPFRVNNNGKESGLFTGYYEPVLYGATHKGGDFQYPLYAKPADLDGNKPYLTRAEIDNGMLVGKKLELLWVDDPVMLFFMQIQGSGRVRLMNGKEVRMGYADQNGHKYTAIGKFLREENLLPADDINFFTIRQWLYKNRDKAFGMMQRNPSYVFFRNIEGAGPIGSVGVPVTPQRTLAIDNRYIPYGLPLYLETELPAEPQREPAQFNRIMIAQDTGGAIRGPVRGDVFFGSGDMAEYYAGYMKSKGSYSLLVPKEVAAQLRE